MEEGHCVNHQALNYAICGVNILNDLTLLAIPMLFLRNLQVQQRQRIVLFSIFACGIL